MSIKEMLEKIKPFYNLLVIVLIASIFFALGRLSVAQNSNNPLKIVYSEATQTASVVTVSSTTQNTLKIVPKTSVGVVSEDGPVIGSKSGKKYYFPWCGTVKRILPQNQVKFSSILEARKAGFLPGGNCKGLN